MGRRKAPILQQKGSRRSRLDVFSTADEDQAAEEEADPIAAAIEAKKKRRDEELRRAAKAAAAAAAANITTWVEGMELPLSTSISECPSSPKASSPNPLASLIGYSGQDSDEENSPSQSPRAAGGGSPGIEGGVGRGSIAEDKVADFFGELESDGLLDDAKGPDGDSQRSSATESFGGSEVQENAVTTTVAPSEEKAEGNGEGAGVPSGEQKVLGNLEGLPGWSRVLDTASGNIYFWNENTNEVLWDNPLEAAAEPQADAGGSKPTSSAELEGAVSNSLTAIAVATGDLDAIMKAPCEEAPVDGGSEKPGEDRREAETPRKDEPLLLRLSSLVAEVEALGKAAAEQLSGSPSEAARQAEARLAELEAAAGSARRIVARACGLLKATEKPLSAEHWQEDDEGAALPPDDGDEDMECDDDDGLTSSAPPSKAAAYAAAAAAATAYPYHPPTYPYPPGSTADVTAYSYHHLPAGYPAYPGYTAAAVPSDPAAALTPPLPAEPPPLPPPDEDGPPPPPQDDGGKAGGAPPGPEQEQPAFPASVLVAPQPQGAAEAAAELMGSSLAWRDSAAVPVVSAPRTSSSGPVIVAAPSIKTDVQGLGRQAATEPVLSRANGTASSSTKTAKADGGTSKKTKSRKLPKTANSLLTKWQAVREAEREAEALKTAAESELFDPEALRRKRMREAEEWRIQQLATGDAADNANFQPLAGDWREKVKKARKEQDEAPPPANSGRPDLVKESIGLPPGWQAMWDKGSGEIYYGNLSTGETTWERPGA